MTPFGHRWYLCLLVLLPRSTVRMVMVMNKNSWLPLVLVGILCCGVLQVGVSQASPEEGKPVRAICESPRPADGDYSFDGSPFGEANDASDELASVFGRYRDVWGGGRVLS